MLRCEMLGRVGQDPETRYTGSGDAVTNFSMAHTDKWKDKNSGEQREKTEWVRFVAIGRQAEIIGEHVGKGSQLFVAGPLQTRKWEKDGQTHYATEVKVKEFEFVGSKVERQSSPQSQPGQQQSAPAPADDFDDDIPF